MKRIMISILLLFCPVVTWGHGNHGELIKGWLHGFTHFAQILILLMIIFVLGYQIYTRTCRRH